MTPRTNSIARECQADFTYTMNLNVVKVQDTGKSVKAVADDLEAVFQKD